MAKYSDASLSLSEVLTSDCCTGATTVTKLAHFATLFFVRLADDRRTNGRGRSSAVRRLVAMLVLAAFCLVSLRLRCRLTTYSSWLDSLLESSVDEANDAIGTVG